jgi:hypothetical protein
MTVTSVHVRPTSALTSWTTTPIDFRIAAAAGSLAVVVLSQQTFPGEAGGLLRRAGVATARVAKARATKVESCILV